MRHKTSSVLRNFAAYCVISRHNLLDHAHQQKRLSPLARGVFPDYYLKIIGWPARLGNGGGGGGGGGGRTGPFLLSQQ